MESHVRPSKIPFTPKRSHLNISTTASSASPRFYSFPSPGLSRSRTASSRFTTSPPAIPPAWSWSCHHCQTTYPLGATRRCLYDGHFFCAGQTVNKRTGRVKRHKACGSVFDYVGWKEHGEWRRNEVRMRDRDTSRLGLSEQQDRDAEDLLSTDESDAEFPSDAENKGKPPHNCETDCNFPSECRWRPRLTNEKLKRKTAKKKSSFVEQMEENKGPKEQMVLFELEPESETQRKVNVEQEPDTPMPPSVDLGCRQSSTADMEIPKPLRVRQKATGSGFSLRRRRKGPLSSNPPATTPPSPTAANTSSPSSSSAPMLPELHFPTIAVDDFSAFKARNDAAHPLLSPRAFSFPQTTSPYSSSSWHHHHTSSTSMRRSHSTLRRKPPTLASSFDPDSSSDGEMETSSPPLRTPNTKYQNVPTYRPHQPYGNIYPGHHFPTTNADTAARIGLAPTTDRRAATVRTTTPLAHAVTVPLALKKAEA
ncbi:MAG: hypothetical protein LQ340_006852, partial [Diploschistes diacapsis]